MHIALDELSSVQQLLIGHEFYSDKNEQQSILYKMKFTSAFIAWTWIFVVKLVWACPGLHEAGSNMNQLTQLSHVTYINK